MSLCSSYVFHLSCPLCITCTFFVGKGVTLLTDREIDDTYLDFNEEEIKKHFQKFKDDWPRCISTYSLITLFTFLLPFAYHFISALAEYQP
jgi:hypothetical protein